MNRKLSYLAIALALALGLWPSTAGAQPGAGDKLRWPGYQPWWDNYAKPGKAAAEEQRLQKFWHDYYDGLRTYYGQLDRIDWVAYYKNHGYPLNSGGAQCQGGR